jgi:iron complex transport system substrate-binding protein
MASEEIDALVRQQLEDTGSLYTLDMDLVRELRPEIVLTQQLCTVCAVGYATVRAAMRSLDEPPEVINLEPKNLAGVFDSIVEVGELLGVRERALERTAALRERLAGIPALVGSENKGMRDEGMRDEEMRDEEMRDEEMRDDEIWDDEVGGAPRVLLLEWLIPPFSAGHWMGELVMAAGGIPVLANIGEHSRGLSWEAIAAADFDTIVISCCGFGVERAMRDVASSAELAAVLRSRPGTRLFVFDGNHFFSRPGPRLVESAELLHRALAGVAPEDAGSTIAAPYRAVDIPSLLSSSSHSAERV